MISAVIPHWSRSSTHDDYLKECVKSLDANEIIVVVNDGIGFGKAVNQGLKLASGQYICVVNNDTRLVAGSLKELCHPDMVCVPDTTNQRDLLPRAFYCMPREVLERVGGYDEQFEVGYFEDDDFIMRLYQANITITSVPSVRVEHVGGATIDKLDDRNTVFEKNKQRFIEKWGGLPHEVFEKKGKL